MKTYELALVLNSNLTEDKRKKLLETIKGWLKEVKVAKEDVWGQKVLSYPIKREKIGFFQLLTLETDALPSDFEKRLIANDQVLRHLLVKKK